MGTISRGDLRGGSSSLDERGDAKRRCVCGVCLAFEISIEHIAPTGAILLRDPQRDQKERVVASDVVQRIVTAGGTTVTGAEERAQE